MNKLDKIKRTYPSDVTRTKDDHLPEIRQYIDSRGEYPLLPSHQAIYERLQSIWKARTNTAETFKNRAQIVREHAQDFGLSVPQAENDWHDCITLFRQYTNIDPNTELYITLGRFDELINEARQAGKIEAALQALGKRAELVGKLQPDPNKPDFNKQVPQVTALIIDDFTRALFEKAKAKLGNPDFYQAFLKLVLDIDDPLTFDFRTFIDAETLDFETVQNQASNA